MNAVQHVRSALLMTIIGFAGCGTGMDPDLPEPLDQTLEALATIEANELAGLSSTIYGGRDFNRCVPNVVWAVNQLRDRGDIVGFHYGTSTAFPDTVGKTWHWQGIQRMPTALGRHLVVATSMPKADDQNVNAGCESDECARLAVVQMTSRNTTGKRLRGNRMSTSNQDWDIEPDPLYRRDTIRHNQVLSAGGLYNHPGGIQAVGKYLYVGLERSGTSWPASVEALDFSNTTDPWSPSAPPKSAWRYVLNDQRAGAVAGAKLSDGRHLLVVLGPDSHLNFNISSPGADIERPQFRPVLRYDAAAAQIGWYMGDYWYSNQTGIQGINLITECDPSGGNRGQLYLLATYKTLNDVQAGDDYADLFELNLFETASGYGVTMTRKVHRHFWCKARGSATGQCDFDAAVGSYVDPNGRLLLYATEHDNDGPPCHEPQKEWSTGQCPVPLSATSVKMMEFAPVPTESCPSLSDAWVGLYDGYDLNGDTMWIDFVDRFKRDYSNFGEAYNFHDMTNSVRWCIPSGWRYRLWEHSNRTGTPYDLVGTDSPRWLKSSSTWPWSSGCFQQVGSDVCQ